MTTKYYWINTNGIGVNKHLIVGKNLDTNKWMYDTLTGREFLSDYKLKMLHGTDCILREVDFEKDVRELGTLNHLLELRNCTSDQMQVFLGNSVMFWYSSIGHVVTHDFTNVKELHYD